MMPALRHFPPPRALCACAAAGILLALTGCAAQRELNTQMVTSRVTLEQAQAAGAPTLAPDDFNVAHQHFEQAAAAARNQNYPDALRLAEQAQADAERAQARTSAVKARTAAIQVLLGNQALRQEIERSDMQTKKGKS